MPNSSVLARSEGRLWPRPWTKMVVVDIKVRLKAKLGSPASVLSKQR